MLASHVKVKWSEMRSLSRVWFFATPWTVAYQASPSMGFSRQAYWSGLPFPSRGDLPDPRIGPGSPALQVDALPYEPPRKPSHGKGIINFRSNSCPFLLLIGSKTANQNQKNFESLLVWFYSLLYEYMPRCSFSCNNIAKKGAKFSYFSTSWDVCQLFSLHIVPFCWWEDRGVGSISIL